MGIMVRYVDPSNWLALEVRSSDGKPRLLRRQNDGTTSTVYTSVVGTGMCDRNCSELGWCAAGRTLQDSAAAHHRALAGFSTPAARFTVILDETAPTWMR